MDTIQAIGRDLAHAARSLMRARAFTFVCVVSLGLGMGAFVGLVTFMRAMTAPARGIETTGLMELLITPQGPLRMKAGVDAIEEWTYPDFEDLRHADTGMALTGWASGRSEFGEPEPGDDTPMQRSVLTYFVSSNYFSTFGVALARGSGFDPAIDDRPSAAPRVVISHGFWQDRLASDPDIVGKTVVLSGVPHTVVGITPAAFRGPFNALGERAPRPVLFVPLERHPRLHDDANARLDRTRAWVHIHGRLAPGIDRTQADARMSALMSRLSARFPATNAFKTASVQPYFSNGAARRSQTRRIFAAILGLAGMVLLIVCVNISGMMLVRGAVRERELSIREAVGASRWRLMQYLFFEAVWLAVIGGGLSVMVLFGLPAGIARWFGETVPPELDFDLTAVAICAGLCFVVSLVLGLLPALRMSRPDVIRALKDDAGGGGRAVGRLHRAAVALQVAIAVPFLVLSGVMLDRVRTADFGVDLRGVVAARVDPTALAENGDLSIRAVRDALVSATGGSPIAMADGMPVDFDYREVRVTTTNGSAASSAQVTRVAEGYLPALGVRVLRGRDITRADRDLGERVVVISEPLAARLFPDNDAIGQQVVFADADGRDQTLTVIGVSSDFATSQLTTERPQMLLPLPEQPSMPVYLIARGATTDETRLASAFENVGRDLHLSYLPGNIPEFDGVVTGARLIRKSIADLISESVATAVAGGIVLVLASLGILGIVAFMVTTRTREIAVRMALGASRLRVVRLLLSDVVLLVAPGVVIGLLIGAVLIRTLTEVMGTPLTVGPTPLGAVEPLIYVTAAVVTIGIALVAGLPAARRATTVQPMQAMRSE
ncbi:MAG: ABC transporter permease [Acidobacteria bacterium]|nr:ABC transporter permease [Acidobacteriota bacterium]